MRGFAPIFILQRGGPILDRFQGLGPTFLLAEGWDAAALGEGLRPHTPSLGSTAWSASVLNTMKLAGPHAVAVHEMLEYVRAHDLLEAVGETRNVIASFPGQLADLRASLPAQTRVTHVQPALIYSRVRSLARRRVGRLLTRKWGKDRIVFLGAGFADHRKGFDLFLAAARRIHARLPEARFVWLGERAGWGRDLADAAIADGLALFMPGFVTDAAGWYAHATVYLLTSRQDPGPTTVMDAARAGVPFVAYRTDLGLLAHADELRLVGTFVDTDEEFDAQVLAYVDHDTAARRRARARAVAKFTHFPAYVDGLLEAVSAESLPEEPSKVTQVVHTSARAAHPLVRRSIGEAYDVAIAVTRALGLPPPPRPVRTAWLTQWMQGSRRATAVVAIRDGMDAPAGALTCPEQVQALNAGERVWVADAALLEHLPRRAVVYLARADAAPGSPAEAQAVSAIEAGSHAIERLHQYRADNLPRWMSAGAAPPPLRAFVRRSAPSRAQASRASAPAPLRTTGPAPIGVFVHIYYPELADALAERIRLIPRPMKLYVSTDSAVKAERMRELFPEADVRVFSNRGRDVYPKIYGFADAYPNHEIVLHLHAKRSPHLSAPGGWLDHILSSLLPSTEGIEAILRRFDSDPHLGMVSPTPYGPIASSYGWTVNRAVAQALTWSRGWRLPGDRGLQFPAGSMFWARTEALSPLRELDLSIDVFPEDAPLRDGSVAHALERLIGVSCSQAGLRQAFIAPTRKR